MGNQQTGLNYSLSTSDMDSGFEESSSSSSQHSSPHLQDNSLLKTARLNSASSFHFEQSSTVDIKSDESNLSPLLTSTPISGSNVKLARFSSENKLRSSSSSSLSAINNTNLASSDYSISYEPSATKGNRTQSISIQKSKSDNRTISEEVENEDDYVDSDEHLDNFNSNEVFVDTNSDVGQVNESLISVSSSLSFTEKIRSFVFPILSSTSFIC
jgi:hypothetical protein